LQLLEKFRSPAVGTYMYADEKVALVPPDVTDPVFEEIEKALGVEVIRTTIGGMTVIGAMVNGNSNALIVPAMISPEELRKLRDISDNIVVMDDRLNAYGNNLLISETACLAHPKYADKELETFSEALGVDVMRGSIAGQRNVGSCAVVTPKGMLCHPKLYVEERTEIESLFGFPANPVTINFGSPFVGSGIIANTQGAVVGSETTGIELNRIEDGLELY